MNISRSFQILALLLLLASGQFAFAHGFVLSLDDNTIQAASEVPAVSPHLFLGGLDAASTTVLFADHGGVEAGDGIQVPPDTFRIDFAGPLWYSDGSLAQPASNGLTLNATSYDSAGDVLGNPVNITGTSLNPGGFPVAGDDSHSIGWILSGNSIPAGVYGFKYLVTGMANGSTPLASSVPLVIAFNTPDFTGGNLSAAQQNIFNAALQGDFNRDGQLTAGDVPAMLQALADLNDFQKTHDVQAGDLLAIADLDRDGEVSNLDIQSLLNLLTNREIQPANVPEPRSVVLLICALATAPLAKLFRTRSEIPITGAPLIIVSTPSHSGN